MCAVSAPERCGTRKDAMPDFLDLSRHFTDEERAIQQTVRAFVDARVLPIIGDHWEKGTFPAELIPEIAELGLLGCNLQGLRLRGPVRHRLRPRDAGARARRLRHPQLRQRAGLARRCTRSTRSARKRRRSSYLPEMAKGEIIGCFGLTEPDYGSNPAGMRTVAIDDGDSCVLNGTKRWITNGNLAHVALVWAKVGGVDGEVRGFLVPTDTKGFEAQLIHKKMSLRASVTSELILEDVRIPKDAILADVRGMKGPLSVPHRRALRHRVGRHRLGHRRASTARSTTPSTACSSRASPSPRTSSCRPSSPRCSRRSPTCSSWPSRSRASRARRSCARSTCRIIKRHNVRAALEIARVTRDILGGNGITLEYPIMRHMCNLETVYTYEGTHDIHTLILGQDITGIAAYE